VIGEYIGRSNDRMICEVKHRESPDRQITDHSADHPITDHPIVYCPILILAK
jgi:hypothetical protein